MSITLKDIYDSLEKDVVNYNLIDNEINNKLLEVKLLVKGQKKFKENTVYVGAASFVENMNLENIDLALVIINDKGEYSTSKWKYLKRYIELSSTCDLFEKFNEINDIFNNEQKLNQIEECGDLFQIAEKSSVLLKNPMIIIDSSFRVIAHSNTDSIRDKGWKENIEKGYCSYEYITIVNKMEAMKETHDNSIPFMLSCYTSPIKRYVSKYFLHGKFRGYVVVLMENDELEISDLENIKAISKITSTCYGNMLSQKNISNIEHDNFLLDLLNNKVTDEETLKEKLKIYKGEFKSEMVMVVIDIKDFDAKTPVQGYLAKEIDKLLNRRNIFYENQVVILYDFEPEAFDEKDIYKNLEEFAVNNNVIVGMSNIFSDLTLVHKHYVQAKKTLEIKGDLHLPSYLIKFKDIGFYALHHEVESKGIDIKAYLHPVLKILRDYDQTNGTDLYKTLFEYLKTNSNAVLTGKKLFLHRNTVKYRIDKVTELTRIDLDNDLEVFNIMFSYRAMLTSKINF